MIIYYFQLLFHKLSCSGDIEYSYDLHGVPYGLLAEARDGVNINPNINFIHRFQLEDSMADFHPE